MKLLNFILVLAMMCAATSVAPFAQAEPPYEQLLEDQVAESSSELKLPHSILVDSTAFYTKFKNQDGEARDVSGFWGRFGSTLSEKKKSKVLKKMAKEGSDYIIWTLDDTYADAEALQERLRREGIEASIVSIPRKMQERILEMADLNELPMMKRVLEKSKRFIENTNIKESYKILKDQKVKPSKEEWKTGMTIASISVVGTLPVWMYLIGDTNPGLAVAITAIQSVYSASMATFVNTISGVFKSNYHQDFQVVSQKRELLRRMTLLNLTTMGLVREVAAPHVEGLAPMASVQGTADVVSQLSVEGVGESSLIAKRNRYLSAEALRRLNVYHFLTFFVPSRLNLAGLYGWAATTSIYGVDMKVTAPLVTMAALYGTGYWAIGKYRSFFEKLGREGAWSMIKSKFGGKKESLAQTLLSGVELQKEAQLVPMAGTCRTLF